MEEDIESFITEFADRIAHYHIKNYKFTDSTVRHKAPDEFYTNKFNYLKGCFLDEGSIDFSSVFNCIRRTGHKGRFSLESTCNYDTTEQFHKDLAFLNHLIENNQTEGPPSDRNHAYAAIPSHKSAADNTYICIVIRQCTTYIL